MVYLDFTSYFKGMDFQGFLRVSGLGLITGLNLRIVIGTF